MENQRQNTQPTWRATKKTCDFCRPQGCFHKDAPHAGGKQWKLKRAAQLEFPMFTKLRFHPCPGCFPAKRGRHPNHKFATCAGWRHVSCSSNRSDRKRHFVKCWRLGAPDRLHASQAARTPLAFLPLASLPPLFAGPLRLSKKNQTTVSPIGRC